MTCTHAYSVIVEANEIGASAHLDSWEEITTQGLKLLRTFMPSAGYCEGETEAIVTSLGLLLAIAPRDRMVVLELGSHHGLVKFEAVSLDFARQMDPAGFRSDD